MIGERIKQRRKAVGLSQRALAGKIGVSATAISKFERGQLVPSSDLLLKLGEALGVRVEYFFRTTRVRVESVEYRKHAKLPKRVQSQIEGDLIEQVERYIELEGYFQDLPIEPFEVPGSVPAMIADYEAIEDVATAVRDAWQLGRNAIPELTDTLEERGIKVLLTDVLHGDRFDGLAAKVNGVPVVVIGKGWPGDRQRFTLAHELGHFLLDQRLASGLDPERAANRFAGAFLVPASEARKELGNYRRALDPGELCVLKMAYGLSMNAWLYRTKELGIITPTRYEAIARTFRARGWHKREPCREYPREEPKLFRQLVFHALAEELISEAKASELLRIPMWQLQELRIGQRAKADAQL